MADTWEVQAPDGSTIEVQSDHAPSQADALRAMRAYGDQQAAAAQKRAEVAANPTYQVGQAAANWLGNAGLGALQSINPVAIAKSLWQTDQATQAKRQADEEALNRGENPFKAAPQPPVTFAGAAQGTKQALSDAFDYVGDPERGGRLAGQLATMAVLPKVLPKVPGAVAAGGEALTRGGESLASSELPLGGVGGTIGYAIGGPKGMATGTAIGGAIPRVMRGTGRLITAAGRMAGRAIPPDVPPVAGAEPSPVSQDDVSPPPAPSIESGPAQAAATPTGGWFSEAQRAQLTQQGVTPEQIAELEARTASQAARPGLLRTRPLSQTPAAAAPAAASEGMVPEAGVKAPPPVIDPEAQAVRDQTAATPDVTPEEPPPKTEEEISRGQGGARDEGRTTGKTTEEVRATSRNRFTGELGVKSGHPLKAVQNFHDFADDALARNAPLSEWQEYVRGGRTPDERIAIGRALESYVMGKGRPSPFPVLAGAAVGGGAMLRKALVDQLGGQDREQEQ